MTGDAGFRVGRRGDACAACGAALVPGKIASSALYRAPESGEASFVRRDFCGPCFEDPARRGEPFSWWSAPVPQPAEKKAVFDTGVAKEFLARLLRENAPEHASLRYLLVLLLLRKKLVKVTDQFTRDGTDVMVVAVPPEETVHEVACVDLDEAESERLREELGRLFAL